MQRLKFSVVFLASELPPPCQSPRPTFATNDVIIRFSWKVLASVRRVPSTGSMHAGSAVLAAPRLFDSRPLGGTEELIRAMKQNIYSFIEEPPRR